MVLLLFWLENWGVLTRVRITRWALCNRYGTLFFLLLFHSRNDEEPGVGQPVIYYLTPTKKKKEIRIRRNGEVEETERCRCLVRSEKLKSMPRLVSRRGSPTPTKIHLDCITRRAPCAQFLPLLLIPYTDSFLYNKSVESLYYIFIVFFSTRQDLFTHNTSRYISTIEKLINKNEFNFFDDFFVEEWLIFQINVFGKLILEFVSGACLNFLLFCHFCSLHSLY